MRTDDDDGDGELGLVWSKPDNDIYNMIWWQSKPDQRNIQEKMEFGMEGWHDMQVEI